MATDECLEPAQALALFAGSLRQPGSGLRELSVGHAADLCLLDVPWEELCADLEARHIVLTLCGGSIAYAAGANTNALAFG
jgi:hypothetical protein